VGGIPCSFLLQELVQVISDAYVVLDWDDRTLAAKLLPVAAAQRQPPGDAPRDVRRACIRLLSAALAWSEFRWAPALADKQACDLKFTSRSP
jgi:hypothetical protein